MKFIVPMFAAIGMWITSTFAMDFVHPGALDSRAELDFVKARMQAGAQPWKGELDRMKTSGYATRGPHGLTTINSNNNDASVSRDDAIAAYTQALLWYYTDDETYAKRAVAILNAWTSLQGFTAGSDQDRLQAGWIGAVFAPAAEIIRLYPGWSPSEIAGFQAMFIRAFYPQLNTASTWNGNVDLTQIDAIMAIAVFNEDEAEFNLGLARLRNRVPAYFYLTSDGARPKSIAGDGGDLNRFWFYPLKWVDGLNQETCRDNGHHSQFALASALHAAEVAWHQGIDVYSENRERFTAAMELMAAQFLAGSMQGVSSNDVPTPDRYDSWQIGYHHYHNRAGFALPNTEKLIADQIRPWAPRSVLNLNYETATHADLPGTISISASATAVTSGSEVSLVASSAAGMSPISYQWRLDGQDIPGATSASFTAPSAQAFHAGSYTLVVNAGGHAYPSNSVSVTVAAAPASNARLLNLSTRALGLTNHNQLIPGFVLSGTGTKRMLVRAVGPGLRDSFGLGGVLADPQMSLRSQGTGAEISANNDWEIGSDKAAIIATSKIVGAFPLLDGSKDAVLLVDLPAGAYTAPTVGTDGGTGVALVELYDADDGPSTCRLVNISNRGFVDVGEKIMIPGFVVSREGARTFLIRAVGPGLASTFKLDGALADPVLTVFKGGTPILANDDWSAGPGAGTTAGTAAAVGAFSLIDGSRDAAFVVSLPPGAYTVQAVGKGGTTGIALVEVYLVP